MGLCSLCFGRRTQEESAPFEGGSNMNGSSSIVPYSVIVPSTTPGLAGEIPQSANLKIFSSSLLEAATQSFHPDNLLYEGLIGFIFRGWIDQNLWMAARPGRGLEVAVRKLDPTGFQDHQNLLKEVNYLGRACHPNIVKLIGYCLEEDHRFLVYEFMPKGRLEIRLFRRFDSEQLSWNHRMRIALDVAKGLAYLHSNEANVIHGDVTSSNILLDSNCNAKLYNFGFMRKAPVGSNSHTSTGGFVGTYGYAAPECVTAGHLSTKGDVYSFGVVLLELLSGRRAVEKDRAFRGQTLVEFAMPYLSSRHTILQVLDVRIQGQSLESDALKAAALALRCISRVPRFRPTMEEVVTALEPLCIQN